jgi:hypothetical protein
MLLGRLILACSPPNSHVTYGASDTLADIYWQPDSSRLMDKAYSTNTLLSLCPAMDSLCNEAKNDICR